MKNGVESLYMYIAIIEIKILYVNKEKVVSCTRLPLFCNFKNKIIFVIYYLSGSAYVYYYIFFLIYKINKISGKTVFLYGVPIYFFIFILICYYSEYSTI